MNLFKSTNDERSVLMANFEFWNTFSGGSMHYILKQKYRHISFFHTNIIKQKQFNRKYPIKLNPYSTYQV